MLWLTAARNVQVYPCLLGLSLPEILCSRKLEDKFAVVRCGGQANKFSIAVFEVTESTFELESLINDLVLKSRKHSYPILFKL